MRISLKQTVWERSSDTLVVVCDPSRQITLHDPDGQAEELLVALSHGPQTLPELHENLTRRGVRATVDQLQAALSVFDSLRLLYDVDDDATPMSPDGGERYYSNLAFFSAFATLDVSAAEMQRRLARAHVLQLGTGGLGSNVLQSLAGLGVGRLTLLDHDIVETRNFARQFLYRESDLGSSKVKRAMAWVQDYDSRIDVAAVERKICGPDDIADLLPEVSLVVSGVDQPAAVDQWVNEACVRAGVPWVRGGMLGTELQYFSVDPGRSPCLACRDTSYAELLAGDDEDLIGSRLGSRLARLNRGIGPAAALIGSLVAFEALRYLTGYEPPHASGAQVRIQISEGIHPRRQAWKPDPACVLCDLARKRLEAGSHE
ncbi:HesA/MoeB/ThiF family protein [Nonomuraea sp. NPDC050451]|uniref:HesA/MoeB/ThiF family protein n=1 Tax=Nonomuraea sp. NPDC050451 TaxID=3364364 RepID=UPI0037A44C92